jgi:hypothetical protein
MNCMEFRRLAGADPARLDAVALTHRGGCAACAEYHASLLAMDETIRRALLVPVPDRAPSPAVRSRPVATPRQRWLALAASVVAGVLVGTLLWVGGPRASLAREVVTHIRLEPQSLTSTAAAPAALARVLAAGGIRLRPGANDVTYANSCPFRGHVVPHLVVRTAQGPVTVLVLANEHVRRPVRVREDGLEGSLVPAGPGSIAVIGGAKADLSDVTARVLAAVEWIGTPPTGGR